MFISPVVTVFVLVWLVFIMSTYQSVLEQGTVHDMSRACLSVCVWVNVKCFISAHSKNITQVQSVLMMMDVDDFISS